MSASKIGSGTPPHHPIYRVILSPAHIEKIVQVVFPGRPLTSIRPLGSGSSFNNRIYFLTVQDQEFVLKVNGRFFGPDKIQNEVSCLNILKLWCPGVPVPRVVAWSEDGSTIMVDKQEATVSLADQGQSSGPGWVLMTRLPGEPVSSVPVDEQAMASIGAQLADLVACWRSEVPATYHCGNLLFHSSSGSTHAPDIILNPDGPCRNGSDALVIRGLLGEGILPSAPISNLLQLHRSRLESKLVELETKATYAPNRRLAPLVSAFVNESLPRLLDKENQISGPKFIFTHYDLAPRNVLILPPEAPGALPRITGLVDLEFAGFFPPTDEFVNDFVDNGGDWPEPAYCSYLARLEELGVATPSKGIEDAVWKREHLLGKLSDNIAPWWLPGEFEGDELASKLAECREVVESVIGEMAHLHDTVAMS